MWDLLLKTFEKITEWKVGLIFTIGGFLFLAFYSFRARLLDIPEAHMAFFLIVVFIICVAVASVLVNLVEKGVRSGCSLFEDGKKKKKAVEDANEAARIKRKKHFNAVRGSIDSMFSNMKQGELHFLRQVVEAEGVRFDTCNWSDGATAYFRHQQILLNLSDCGEVYVPEFYIISPAVIANRDAIMQAIDLFEGGDRLTRVSWKTFQ